MFKRNEIYHGNAISIVSKWPDNCIHHIFTSPPYWGGVRRYGEDVVVYDPPKKDSYCAMMWKLFNIDYGCNIGTPCKDGHKWISFSVKGKKIHHGQGKTTLGYGVDGTYRIKDAPKITELTSKDEKDPTWDFCLDCGATRGQLGTEPDLFLYVEHLCQFCDEARRVLVPWGSIWFNVGDVYTSVHTGGRKSPKGTVGANKPGIQEVRHTKVPHIAKGNLSLVPHHFAFAMQARGWQMPQEIVWKKPNPVPESVISRCTRDYEYIFMFTKSSNALYWTNPSIGKVVGKKPPGIHGKENFDWEWVDCTRCEATGKEPDENSNLVECRTCKGSGKRKNTLWEGWRYYYELQYEKQESSEEQFYAKLDKQPHKLRRGEFQPRGQTANFGEAKFNPMGRHQRSTWEVKDTGIRFGGTKYPEGDVKGTYSGRVYIENPLGRHQRSTWDVEFSTDFAFFNLFLESFDDKKKFNIEEVKALLLGFYQRFHPDLQVKGNMWTLSTSNYKGSHYAVFPIKLVEAVLKPGCPLRVCSKCGLPAVKRVIVKERKDTRPGKESKYNDISSHTRNDGGRKERRVVVSVSSRWCKCDCGADFERGISYDPFGGTGSTAVGAVLSDRDYVLTEVNQKYVEMATKRIKEEAGEALERRKYIKLRGILD
jgi:DNA modification methylase